MLSLYPTTGTRHAPRVQHENVWASSESGTGVGVGIAGVSFKGATGHPCPILLDRPELLNDQILTLALLPVP